MTTPRGPQPFPGQEKRLRLLAFVRQLMHESFRNLNHAPDYFDAMGIPIVRGRAFTEADENERSTTRRYAIVNESFAEKYWPGQDPIGHDPEIIDDLERGMIRGQVLFGGGTIASAHQPAGLDPGVPAALQSRGESRAGKFRGNY